MDLTFAAAEADTGKSERGMLPVLEGDPGMLDSCLGDVRDLHSALTTGSH